MAIKIALEQNIDMIILYNLKLDVYFFKISQSLILYLHNCIIEALAICEFPVYSTVSNSCCQKQK